MLRFLFPRLTPPARRGAALFQAVTAEARAPVWFRDAGVPDTVSGRFAMLATMTALVSIRLERGEAAAREANAALTERFVETMDAEHREMGLGDPTLGKTIRKLVGALGRRIELWRGAIDDPEQWGDAAARSLYGGDSPTEAAVASAALRQFWERIAAKPDDSLIEGDFA